MQRLLDWLRTNGPATVMVADPDRIASNHLFTVSFALWLAVEGGALRILGDKGFEAGIREGRGTLAFDYDQLLLSLRGR